MEVSGNKQYILLNGYLTLTARICSSGGGTGHMAAVKALACLVHCPVRHARMQSPPFPLSEVMPDRDRSKSAEQAAALQRLEKVRSGQQLQQHFSQATCGHGSPSMLSKVQHYRRDCAITVATLKRPRNIRANCPGMSYEVTLRAGVPIVTGTSASGGSTCCNPVWCGRRQKLPHAQP